MGSFGKEFEAHAPLHIDEQGFQIEIFVRRVPHQPPLSPDAERAHETREFRTRVSESVFRAMLTIYALDRAGEHQGLQSLRKHGPRNPWDPAADVIEAPAAAEQFAHDQ